MVHQVTKPFRQRCRYNPPNQRFCMLFGMTATRVEVRFPGKYYSPLVSLTFILPCIYVPDTSGGAIYVLGSLRLSNTAFVANTAGEKGPAVDSVSVLSRVEFSNVSFQKNAYRCPLGRYADYESSVVSETS